MTNRPCTTAQAASALPLITPDALRQRLESATTQPDHELAIIDVREEGLYGQGHLLRSSNLPLSRLELLAPRLLPRRSVPIVLCDANDGLAERAATVLRLAGYTDLTRLAGGVAAWAERHPLFSGNFVFSKAFGEHIEVAAHTPAISVQELRELQAAGANLAVFDSRTYEEYQWIGIPGAISCPGAELVWRVHGTVTDPETLVVVSCGGRTRSIVGAQTLIHAGLPNRVVSLTDGTQGWHLAGFDTVQGQTQRCSAPDTATVEWARQAAAGMGQAAGVRLIDAATLARFVAEQHTHTLYRYDTRPAEEYQAGHVPGFLHVAGGQLIQATNTHIAVHGARIVLADAEGVRAVTTAAWLRQMGYADVYVLNPQDALDASLPSASAASHDARLPGTRGRAIGAFDLRTALAWEHTVLIDLASSRDYRKGHIPGAWFAIRGRLAQALRQLPATTDFVLTSPDGVLADLAAEELAALVGSAHVRVLAGGTRAWEAAGLPTTADSPQWADEPVDVTLKAFERETGRERAMQDYLSWERSLVEQLQHDGSTRFALAAPDGTATARS